MHKHVYMLGPLHHDDHLIATDTHTHNTQHTHTTHNTHTHTTPIINLNYSTEQFVSAHKLVSECTQISLQWYHVYSVVHDCLMSLRIVVHDQPVLGSV